MTSLWVRSICSKSNIFRPNQNSKISLDFRHHKDSRRGVLKYFLTYDIAPTPPLIIETLRFTTQRLNNVLSNVIVSKLLTCKLASRPSLLQLSNSKELFLFKYINIAPLHRLVDLKVPIMLRSPWISLDSFCPQLNNIKKVLAQTILKS